jgi:hypothetical protein
MILVHGFKISVEKFFRDANRHGMIRIIIQSVLKKKSNLEPGAVLCLVKGYRMMGKVIDRILIFCFGFLIVKSD